MYTITIEPGKHSNYKLSVAGEDGKSLGIFHALAPLGRHEGVLYLLAEIITRYGDVRVRTEGEMPPSLNRVIAIKDHGAWLRVWAKWVKEGRDTEAFEARI